MKDRFVLAIVAVILTLVGGRARADQVGDNFADPDGSIALAEHFATFAHQTFHQDKIPLKAMQLDAALYRAAMKLNPNESRFPRALADIMLEMSDVPGATDTLKKYMAIEPADQTAQVQYIDLCLASDQMQSLDQRLTYLRYLLEKQQIPDPVKSEIAYRAAQLLMDRGQNDEALKLLDSARVLNPMNLKALRTRYIMTQATDLPVDRVQQLLAILEANPTDPVVASRLAEQLAQLGLVGPSINWYGIADQLYNATKVRADPAFVLGASSELLLGKHAEDAARLAARYTVALPEDADGWFVILSILKFQLSLYQDETMRSVEAATVQKASIAISNRILVLRKMTGDTTAATRPVDSPTDTVLPDLSDDAGRFKATQYRDLVGIYESSLESLAWLDLYYRHDAAAATPLIQDLARFAPPNDPTYLRLLAWKQYVAGDAKGALPKLQALGVQDPLAALGAILIELSDPDTQPQAVLKAQKLLNDHASGVIAAVLWSAFTDYHLSVEASPDSGPAAALAANMPQAFLQLVTEPHGFYNVQVTPLKAAFQFGEPILVRVTLQNLSSVNMAIGDDSAVHPELWFDAHLRGAMKQGLAGVAVGRLDQRILLPPGDSVSTVVRVDQDALHRLFVENPKIDLSVNLLLVMNPSVPQQQNAQSQQAMAEPGICGYAQPSSQLISRQPTPIETPQQRLVIYQALTSDDGGEKMRAMGVIAAYVKLLKGVNDPGIQSVITELIGKLHRVDNGGKEPVLSYQKYLLASVATGADQTDAINAMARDDKWPTRMLALQLANQLGDKGIPIADQLANSKEDPIVRDYAAALSQSLQAAATQPSNPAPAPQTSQTP